MLNRDSLVVTNDRINWNSPHRNQAKARHSDPNYNLSICIDAQGWIVTFYLIREQLGKQWKLVPNETYYLFISFADTYADKRVSIKYKGQISVAIWFCELKHEYPAPLSFQGFRES